MKALVKSHAAPGIWMEDVAEPTPKDNELLIKIRKTAICGTDIHIFHWDEWAQRAVPVPMVIGHEYVGVVADMGKNVTGFAIGDRVSGEGHLTCGLCRNCRATSRHLCRNTRGIGVNVPGAFAEYLCLPSENAIKIPDNVPDEIATILDPFGNAVHTALSYDLIAEDVLITGAGPIGIMAAAVAQKVGARHILVTDLNPYRLALAQKMGATLAINPQEVSIPDAMQKLGLTEGFDVALEMSGNGVALNQTVEAVRHGGKIALLGIPPKNTAINWDHVIFKGLFLKGIYGREMFETWYKMINLIQSGLDLTPIITHRFGINDYPQAFATMASGLSGKVILDWDSL